MLTSLHIKNLALLDEIHLDFDPGFTAVTGETGAGKSILLGALSLLAGARADKTIIRQGAEACEIHATLYYPDSKPIDALLNTLDLPPTDDGTLIIKRTLPREKPPRITINDSPATLNTLATIGETWIDFHGPSEPRRLLKESHQLELLDLYGNHSALLQSYRQLYQQYRELLAQKQALESDAHLTPDQLAFLQNQLSQITQLNPTSDSIAQLELDHKRLSNTQQLIELTGNITNILATDPSPQSQLANLLRQARQLQQLDPTTEPLATRLQSLAIELDDLSNEYSSLAETLNPDPEHAEQIQQQMDLWLTLKRRHGSLEKILAERDAIQLRLSSQSNLAETLATLDAQIAKTRTAAQAAAEKLTAQRKKTAKKFADESSKTIAQLGFKKADFQVEFLPSPDLSPDGSSTLQFLFSPNVGESPLPLNRVASSGELARVMLALKTILATLDATPVLVFDEVDANVGGEIGKTVGQNLKKLSATHQVFCVTHLPQVAAQAQSHYLVEKDQSGQRAKVQITPIHQTQKLRVEELARMLGDRTAKSAQSHAKELLENKTN